MAHGFHTAAVCGFFFYNFILVIYFTTSTPQAIATTAPGRRRPAVHTPRRRRRPRPALSWAVLTSTDQFTAPRIHCPPTEAPAASLSD